MGNVAPIVMSALLFAGSVAAAAGAIGAGWSMLPVVATAALVTAGLRLLF
jgi:hypothetical protein